MKNIKKNVSVIFATEFIILMLCIVTYDPQRDIPRVSGYYFLDLFIRMHLVICWIVLLLFFTAVVVLITVFIVKSTLKWGGYKFRWETEGLEVYDSLRPSITKEEE